jgi:uncharacterized membrane protein YebE (DUF533 family)
MTATPRAILHRLFGLDQDRDGESDLLSKQALELAPVPSAAPRRRPLAHPPQRQLQEEVAAKMLHAWLQNRHQTLFPLALNLRNLEPEQRLLLVQAMAASATMAGGNEASLAGLLPSIGGDAAERAALAEAVRAPPPLPGLLQALQRAGIGAHAYTVALLASQGGRAGQAWLDYLAAFFALPAEVTRDLQRRSGRRFRPGAR